MLIRRRHGWEIAQSRATPEGATPEAAGLGRRALLGAAAASLIAPAALARAAFAATTPALPSFPGPMSAPVNPRFVPGRAITPAKDVYTYNNYYEFGSEKDIWEAAQALPLKPWSIRIDGLVAKKQTIGLEDLLKRVTLEERLYRHRCVEAWALTIPWTGFPLRALLAIAEPLASAKYVVFHTIEDRRAMPGLREVWYPWPYTEGLTIAEAANDVAFIATGLYGKPLTPQNGGPIRLVVPWKYGFKSAKAIVQVTFSEKRPVTFWEAVDGSEYGFWANVNPAVPHPRWSQARERLIGFDEVVPTQIYNGYGEWVASLYTGIKGQQLFR
jgi:methionine sulfoxide reductase catalytic subunit